MKRAAAVLAMAFASGAVLAVLAWGAGRVASDRWTWSQYLSWVPSPAFIGAGAVMLGVSWTAARMGSKRGQGSHSRGVRLAAGAILLVATGHLLLIDWRLINAFRSHASPAGGRIRVLDWNVTNIEREEQIIAPVLTQAPDVVVMVNPDSRVHWGMVFEAFGELPHRAADLGMIVASRYPVLRTGATWLMLPPPEDAEGHVAPGAHADPGRAMYVELDTRAALGRTTVLRVIDMPSDERLSRWALAERAAAVIDAWKGPERVYTQGGAGAVITQGAGFPRADVLVGDFNIPRGSASLSLMTRGMENAFDQAGFGWVRSWPRARAVFHIDQTFVGPAVRAVRYEVVDPGVGYHRLQVADIVASPGSAAGPGTVTP
jgi:hypothetical protein